MRLRALRRARGGAAGTSRRAAGVALVFHAGGEPPGDPSLDLVPTLATRVFEAQLGYLHAEYRVVPPSELLTAARDCRDDEPFPVALTFDDNLRSHVEVVAPALARAGLPAAFFLCGASLDAPYSVWWEDLQTVVDRGTVGRAQRLRSRSTSSSPCAGLRARSIASRRRSSNSLRPQHDSVAAELRELKGRIRGVMTKGDVTSLAAAGFEIGFHTRRHHLLPTLGDDALASALTDCRHRLETLAGHRLTMIACAHAKADRRVADAARARGFELGFTGFREAAGPDTDPLLIGRAEARSGPLDEFAGRIASTLTGEPR